MVNVMLISPDICITPTMEDLQNAILHAANEVVACVGNVTMWSEVGPDFPMVFILLISFHFSLLLLY